MMININKPDFLDSLFVIASHLNDAGLQNHFGAVATLGIRLLPKSIFPF